MAKLIDQVKPGMTMEQVRKIIPYKPFIIIADNPMDTNWGGGAFSVKMVDIGYYQDNYVYRLKGGEPSPEMK